MQAPWAQWKQNLDAARDLGALLAVAVLPELGFTEPKDTPQPQELPRPGSAAPIYIVYRALLI